MRLIDADDTVNGLDIALACSRVVAGKDTLLNKTLDIFENARNFVANMPTIDAVAVVHGEWVDAGYGLVFKCSVCGDLEDIRLSKFCPECGAKMRVGKGETLERHSKEDGE